MSLSVNASIFSVVEVDEKAGSGAVVVAVVVVVVVVVVEGVVAISFSFLLVVEDLASKFLKKSFYFVK